MAAATIVFGTNADTMSALRPLSQHEKALLVALLLSKPSTRQWIDSLDDLCVEEMNDGAMGSLALVPKGSEGTTRSFGQQLASGEFTDGDGVPVSVTLNVDKQGTLFELDLWKVNFKPFVEWPDPTVVRIVECSS
jgi:hypothetical protein